MKPRIWKVSYILYDGENEYVGTTAVSATDVDSAVRRFDTWITPRLDECIVTEVQVKPHILDKILQKVRHYLVQLIRKF